MTADSRETEKRWHWSVMFDASFLRATDPIEILMLALTSIPDLARRREAVFLIVAELLNNALDHGLLGLSSDMKTGARGFDLYYDERSRRLAELAEGYIRCDLTCQWADSGGELTISVEDSGPGFEVSFPKSEQAVPGADPESNAAAADNPKISGMGLFLLKSVCKELRTGAGRSNVAVVYTW